MVHLRILDFDDIQNRKLFLAFHIFHYRGDTLNITNELIQKYVFLAQSALYLSPQEFPHFHPQPSSAIQIETIVEEALAKRNVYLYLSVILLFASNKQLS